MPQHIHKQREIQIKRLHQFILLSSMYKKSYFTFLLIALKNVYKFDKYK